MNDLYPAVYFFFTGLAQKNLRPEVDEIAGWFKFTFLKRGDVGRPRGHLRGAEVRNHLF